MHGIKTKTLKGKRKGLWQCRNIFLLQVMKKGRKKSGVITSLDEVSAMKILMEKEFLLLNITPAKKITGNFFSSVLGFKDITLSGEELLAFSNELGIMLNSGISLRNAVNLLVSDTKNHVLQHIISEIASGLDAGNSFSDLLQKFPGAFSKLYISLVKVGEESGRLPMILLRLADYLGRNEAIRKKIVTSLYYPVMILFFGTVLLSLITIFGIPQIKNIYASFGALLPLPTRIYISAGDFFARYWYLFFIFITAVTGLIMRIINSDAGQTVLDNCKLHLPVIGMLCRKIAIARFAIGLSTLYSSGISIIKGVEQVAYVLGNKVMEKAILTSIDSLYEGGTFVDFLRRSKLFPDMALSMIAAGEASGSLDLMLTKLSKFYEEQANIYLQSLSSLFEPIAIIFIGGGMGFIIWILAMPFMQLGSLVK